MMKTRIAAIALIATVGLAGAASAQTYAEQQRWDAAQARYQEETDRYQAERDAYYAARDRDRSGYRGQQDGGYYGGSYDGPAQGGTYDGSYSTNYDAARDYRPGNQYAERRLGANDQVFRGSDGRYYCQRSDGTTGLIVGAAAGGILGNVIDGGRHRAGGTLIGGALGALLGRSVEQNSDIRCR